VSAVLSKAARLMAASRPRSPAIHHVSTEAGNHAYVSNGSRLYDLDASMAAELEAALTGAGDVDEFLERIGLGNVVSMKPDPAWDPPVRSLSLAISQACNLGCGYCYASGGGFGSPSQQMSAEVAERAILRLLEGAEPGERAHVAFIGGEPLVNRGVIRHATVFAAERAAEREVGIGFSITSNGTLLTEDDARFFERHGFAVTISLDGIGPVHDRLRSFADGTGSFDRIMRNVGPLLAMQQRMQVSAHASVTPSNGEVFSTVDALISRGFHTVGISPVLSAPSGTNELDRESLTVLLDQMIRCGEKFVTKTIAGERYPFENMSTALRELHRGTHRPYPCGAAVGYLGVSATGDLAACHRFVNDDAGAMGSLAEGIDRGRRTTWLQDRHVDRQEPCRSCWARYLCGGGCHHEVIHRGRVACDFIRGWLHYCLEAYFRIADACPQYLEGNA